MSYRDKILFIKPESLCGQSELILKHDVIEIGVQADKDLEAKEKLIEAQGVYCKQKHGQCEAKDKLIDELYAKLIRLTKDKL